VDVFLNEQCSICGMYFQNIKDVFVDIKSDNYVCINCAINYGLNIIHCLDYHEYEEDETC
jgi:hypothetical protein